MTDFSPMLSRRTLLGIAAALGGVALTSPHPALARQATPVPVAGGWDDSILHQAFDSAGPVISDETTLIASFADLEAQLQGVGVTRPAHGAGEEELRPLLNALYALALPVDFGANFLRPEWRAFSGFGPEDVYQTADVGDPPLGISMFAGTFDRDAVLSAWTENGYREIASGDVAVYSISEDESFGFENPIQQIFLSRHNNAALIGDGLVLFTSRLDHLQEAVAAATGESPSLTDNDRIAPLLAATPQLASGAIVPGSSIMVPFDPALMLGNDTDAIATAIADQMAAPQMPVVRTAMLGVTPGGPVPSRETALGTGTPAPTPETARMEIALLTLSMDEAQQAINVAGARLDSAVSAASRRPFNEIFASWELSVAPDAPVARISLELGDAWPQIWTDLLYNRDLVFIG